MDTPLDTPKENREIYIAMINSIKLAREDLLSVRNKILYEIEELLINILMMESFNCKFCETPDNTIIHEQVSTVLLHILSFIAQNEDFAEILDEISDATILISEQISSQKDKEIGYKDCYHQLKLQLLGNKSRKIAFKLLKQEQYNLVPFFSTLGQFLTL